ncbi:MAG: MATE family efflux transporter [Ruminococcus sp.]|nr:MATE family efflux transporter [Ruminococcus sp.]
MTKSMTSGNPAKLLLLFAIPVIFGNMFQQLYSIVDTIIVGRALGVHALAAVGCTGSITFLVLGFVNGFTQGLAIITSQRFGAEDEEGVKNSFAASILLSIAVVIFMTITAMLLASTILQALKTPDDIIQDAYIYLQINFFGIFAPVFFNMFSSMIRALGDSKRPLYFLITACFINIVLDLIFVCIFHMGVAGAAWATIIAQSIAALCCLFHIKKHIP